MNFNPSMSHFSQFSQDNNKIEKTNMIGLVALSSGEDCYVAPSANFEVLMELNSTQKLLNKSLEIVLQNGKNGITISLFVPNIQILLFRQPYTLLLVPFVSKSVNHMTTSNGDSLNILLFYLAMKMYFSFQ